MGGSAQWSRSIHLSLIPFSLIWSGNTLHYNPGSLEVRHAVVAGVSHYDRLAEQVEERAGVLLKPSIGCLLPFDGQIVGHIAFGADQGRLEPAVKGPTGQLPYRLGARTNGGDFKLHCFLRLPSASAPAEAAPYPAGVICGTEEARQSDL